MSTGMIVFSLSCVAMALAMPFVFIAYQEKIADFLKKLL